MTGPKLPRSRPQSLHPAHMISTSRTTSPSQDPSGPPNQASSTVSPALYQKMVTELEQAHQQISQLTLEKQQLETVNLKLQQEIDGVRQDLQGGLNRLSQLIVTSNPPSNPVDEVSKTEVVESHQATDLPQSASVEPANPDVFTIPEPVVVETPSPSVGSSYDFLDRLKRRKVEVVSEASRSQVSSGSSSQSFKDPVSYQGPVYQSVDELEDSNPNEIDTNTQTEGLIAKPGSRSKNRRRSSSRPSSRKTLRPGSLTKQSVNEAVLAAYPDYAAEPMVEDLASEAADTNYADLTDTSYVDLYDNDKGSYFLGCSNSIVGLIRSTVWVMAILLVPVVAFGAGFFVIEKLMPRNSNPPSPSPSPSAPR